MLRQHSGAPQPLGAPLLLVVLHSLEGADLHLEGAQPLGVDLRLEVVPPLVGVESLVQQEETMQTSRVEDLLGRMMKLGDS